MLIGMPWLLAALLADPTTPFVPARAEVSIDDESLEILAFDEGGEIVGALLMTPREHHVQIDASFPDGYASITWVLAPDDPSMPPTESLWTDLDR